MAIDKDMEQTGNTIHDENRAPLIAQDKKGKENNFMVYLSTFVAVCGSFAFGSCAGYSSPTQSAIREDLNLSLAEYSLFGSILTFGAMIGAVASGPMADFFGRKGALRISTAFCTAGWLAIYFAQGTLPLDIGRLATGFGMGVFSYVVPVFIAEIAPKQLRGALTAANQLMICTGVSVAFIIGTVLTWRILALTGLIPCAVLLLGLFFVPESPRWLAKIGKQKEFEAALRKLRGKDADISREAHEIQDYIETLEKLPKAKLFDLFERRYLRSVTIGVGLMVCQQFGGINGICFYTSSIFESAGFPADIGTIIYAVIQVVITSLNALFVDKAGRKPLLLVSGAGLVVGCILTAISFFLKTYEIGLEAAPALAVTGILLYIASFSAGMGAVPWIIMSEGTLPLDIGRLATGFGMGVFSYVVPVFIAEIAPKQLRGALTASNQLMICAGGSVAFIIGAVLTWRILSLTGLIPCAVLLVGLFFVPESPRWLAKIGKQKDFEAALRKLRGKDADISGEAHEIQGYIETLEKLPKAKLFDLFERRYSRSVTIGVGLMVCQQFGGINGICFYTSSIFESAGFPADIGTIIYAVLQVVITALNALFVDKAGRKPLLLVSGAGLVVGCILAAISFYLKTYEIALEAAPALAVTGILLYIASFSAGMGAVPWIIMSEIFPINIKGAAGSLASLVNWFGAWAVSFTFNFLLSWSSYGTFLVYAAINLAGIVFIIVMVPETKGRTLEQIQAAINT